MKGNERGKHTLFQEVLDLSRVEVLHRAVFCLGRGRLSLRPLRRACSLSLPSIARGCRHSLLAGAVLAGSVGAARGTVVTSSLGSLPVAAVGRVSSSKSWELGAREVVAIEKLTGCQPLHSCWKRYKSDGGVERRWWGEGRDDI